jgi:hypothetical protein
MPICLFCTFFLHIAFLTVPLLYLASDWYMLEPHCIDVGLALIEMQHGLGVKLGRFSCHSLATMASLKNILLVLWVVPKLFF